MPVPQFVTSWRGRPQALADEKTYLLQVFVGGEKKREEMLDRRDQRFEQALAEQAKMIEELKNKLNMGQLNWNH